MGVFIESMLCFFMNMFIVSKVLFIIMCRYFVCRWGVCGILGGILFVVGGVLLVMMLLLELVFISCNLCCSGIGLMMLLVKVCVMVVMEMGKVCSCLLIRFVVSVDELDLFVWGM